MTRSPDLRRRPGRPLPALVAVVVAASAALVGCAAADLPKGLALDDPADDPLPAEVAALADRTGMTAEARELLAASRPRLHGPAAFNRTCTLREEANVLGCYRDGTIHLLRVDDPRLDGVEEVTAAHELLHAAWDRLDEAERREITRVLERDLADLGDPRLDALVELYRRRDPSVVPTELHSILGTEAPALSAEAEAHYARWFADRPAVARLAAGYRGAFEELERAVAAYDQRLAALAGRIEAAEADLARRAEELEGRRAALEGLRAAGEVVAYNEQVPAYNAAVASYGADLAALDALVGEHNRLVEERNAQAAEHQALARGLGSAALGQLGQKAPAAAPAPDRPGG